MTKITPGERGVGIFGSTLSHKAHAAERVEKDLPPLRTAAKMSGQGSGRSFPLSDPTEEIQMGRSDKDARAPVATLASKSLQVPLITGHCPPLAWALGRHVHRLLSYTASHTHPPSAPLRNAPEPTPYSARAPASRSDKTSQPSRPHFQEDNRSRRS